MHQNESKSFKLKIEKSQLNVTLKVNQLKVTLINYAEQVIYQQIYQGNSPPAASGRTFTSCAELYSWLEKYKDQAQCWKVESAGVIVAFEQSNILKLALQKHEVINLFLCLSETEEIRQQIAYMYAQLTANKKIQEESRGDAIKQLRKNTERNEENIYNLDEDIKNVRKDLQQQVAKVNLRNEENIYNLDEDVKNVRKDFQQQIAKVNLRMQQLDQAISTQMNAFEQSLKQMRFQHDVNTKNQYRNLMTIKEELTLFCQANKIDIRNLTNQVQKANLQKIKADYDKIIIAFDSEIRVKDYLFQPDTRSLQQNKKVYFLNKKSLKCMEDTKDYFKIAASNPYPFGRYQCKFIVKNIKNNGLLLGICNSKAKSQLQELAFNDRNLVAINSCGYVVNRGAMHSFSWKIKCGDQLGMLVSTSTGEIKWFCNHVEIAHAELGGLSKDELFPFIGLGNFCDEIQLIQGRERVQAQQINLTYKNQLANLNQKFGSRSSWKPA